MLDYRVLGGFAVHGADGDMSVGGPQQRRLLARAGLTRGFTDDECRQYLHIDTCRTG
jgi:hypothetical protein